MTTGQLTTSYDETNLSNGSRTAASSGTKQGGASSADARPPSVTARIVCAARGVGVSQSLRDPVAHQLSSGGVARALRWFARPSALSDVARVAVRALSLGIVDHNTVRMLLIDRYVRQWVEQGCDQLVILGAGLDARAFRMPELRDVAVFEVDHAQSQQWKRERARTLTPSCRSLSFVVADFCRDDSLNFQAGADSGELLPSLAAGLRSEGFDPTRRTAWICEGVAAYLDVASIGRLLAVVSRQSAPGSWFAMSYVAPKSALDTGTSKDGLAARLAARVGEPARGWIDADGMRELVDAAGLGVHEDIDWRTWTERVPQYGPALPNLLKERLVVATKGERH